MSLWKPDSVRSLSDTVARLTNDNDLHLALKLVHDFVERIITEPLCVSQVFGSKVLDRLCQDIGSVSLAAAKLDSAPNTRFESGRPVIVYVVTKLQKSGGHTRVIEDFIKAQHSVQHVILSTELEGPSDSESLVNALVMQPDIVLERAPKADYRHRLIWLQKRLIELGPKKVYLFNHHQDSVAVAAIQPEMNLDASFYHHGDHHLCLGLYLTHLKHIDPHPMGYYKCRDDLGIDNVYVPLTVEDRGSRPSSAAFMQGGALTTCTAAMSNKIEIPYFVSYLDVMPTLLKATGGKHIHLGRLTPWALYRIRRKLKRDGIHSNRFIYVPWVPSVWDALHQYKVDLYIASFPYGGGLTLIEAMGAGIPVALHRHIFSRVLSGIDLAYPDAFSWRQPEELLDYCTSITVNDLREAGKCGRQQFEEFHSGEHLRHFLNDPAYRSLIPGLPSNNFSVESDEWAFWVERQLSLHRLLFRFAYREFRRLRTKW